MRELAIVFFGSIIVLAGCTGERTVYHQAEKGEHRDLVRRLVMEEGQDVNQRDEETGLTPLQIAVIEGHDEMVKALLQVGADPNVRDEAGNTPLHQAYALDHEEVVGALLAHGADPTVRNDTGRTPAEMAAQP